MASERETFERKEWLDRKECAAYLTSLGHRISPSRLANLASNNNSGGGPPYYRIRWSRVAYKPPEVADWAKRQMVRIP
jgi:hypothetical protein